MLTSDRQGNVFSNAERLQTWHTVRVECLPIFCTAALAAVHQALLTSRKVGKSACGQARAIMVHAIRGSSAGSASDKKLSPGKSSSACVVDF